MLALTFVFRVFPSARNWVWKKFPRPFPICYSTFLASVREFSPITLAFSACHSVHAQIFHLIFFPNRKARLSLPLRAFLSRWKVKRRIKGKESWCFHVKWAKSRVLVFDYHLKRGQTIFGRSFHDFGAIFMDARQFAFFWHIHALSPTHHFVLLKC